MAASIPELQEIATAECGFSGWLKKSGGVLRLQKLDRWVELYCCELIRYKKKGACPNGTIRLNASVVCSASSDGKSFTLRSGGEKHTFIAKSTDTRDEWVRRISAACVGAHVGELGEDWCKHKLGGCDMLRSSCPNVTIMSDQEDTPPCCTTSEILEEYSISTIEVKEDMSVASHGGPDGIENHDPLQAVESVSSDAGSIQSESTSPTASAKSADYQDSALLSNSQLANFVVNEAVKVACAVVAAASIPSNSGNSLISPSQCVGESIKAQSPEAVSNWQTAAHGGC